MMAPDPEADARELEADSEDSTRERAAAEATDKKQRENQEEQIAEFEKQRRGER